MKKRCRLNKKGYFFVIDALIALGVLAIGVFLVFTFYANVPSKEQPAILSGSIMDFFANNKIKDVDNLYAGLGGSLWEDEGADGGLCDGEELIANGEITLLQQIAIFYEKSQEDAGNDCYFNPDSEDLIERFIGNLVENILPPQYKFEFWLYDSQDLDEPDDDLKQLLYPAAEQTDSKNAAEVLIPSKKIAYGIMNQETGDMFGPYNAEVLVWQ